MISCPTYTHHSSFDQILKLVISRDNLQKKTGELVFKKKI